MIIFVIVAGVYLMIGLSAKQNLFVIEYTGGRIQFRINTGESLAAENFLKRINNARNQEKRSDHQ